jgi:putative transposase
VSVTATTQALTREPTSKELLVLAIEDAMAQLVPLVGTRAACAAVGRSQATHYRHHRVTPVPAAPPAPARTPKPQPRALSTAQRAEVLEVLHSERFADAAPAAVYATLLDEGRYLCSEATMYRILREHGEVRERRRQATHPPRTRPELVAHAPNQCWSWDITKLAGPVKWTSYHLYVIIDIYSRYVPGWLIADRECGKLAEKLLADTIIKQNVTRRQLTVHADRGTSMASKPVALLLADLGVTKSHSRPRCSNDNPFSEAQFKTLKYRPDFPDRFGSLQDARVFCQQFFSWYNHDHRHSGIGLHTPADVHYGRAATIRAARAEVLTAAYATHPERFVRKHPEPPKLPGTVWINKPVPNSMNP